MTQYDNAAVGQSLNPYGTIVSGMRIPSQQFTTMRSSLTAKDPEAIQTLSDIDMFESKKVKKKPSRYPKHELEVHNKLEDTMREKCKLRQQWTQEKLATNTNKYSA